MFSCVWFLTASSKHRWWHERMMLTECDWRAELEERKLHVFAVIQGFRLCCLQSVKFFIIACSVHLRHFKSKCYQSCDLFRHHPLLQHEPFPKCVCGSQSRALGQFIQQPRGFMVYNSWRSFQLYYMPESEDKTSRGCSRLSFFSFILGWSTVTNIKKVKFQSRRRMNTYCEKV